MIRVLSGNIAFKEPGFLVIDVNGVGYQVFCPTDVISSISVGEQLMLWVHLAVRDNSMTVFGFNSKSDLEFFEMLITVSGIGPKTALSIFSVANASALRSAVAKGDTSYLVQVSGIGKKNANKIVLELKEKLGNEEYEIEQHNESDSETMEALKVLGYSSIQSREAIKKIPDNTKDTSERIREALRHINS